MRKNALKSECGVYSPGPYVARKQKKYNKAQQARMTTAANMGNKCSIISLKEGIMRLSTSVFLTRKSAISVRNCLLYYPQFMDRPQS